MLTPCLATVGLVAALGSSFVGPADPRADDPPPLEVAPPEGEPRDDEAVVPDDAEPPEAEDPEQGEADEPGDAGEDPFGPPLELDPATAPEPGAIDPAPAPAEPTAEPTNDAADDEDWFGDDADTEPFPLDDGDAADPSSAAAVDYDPRRDSPQALAARHWVRAGIVTMSTGGALLIGAILMRASDPCNLKIGNSCQPQARNRAALTMAVPATALIVGGATALGIGIKRRQRLAVELQASRRGGGLVLRGRF